MCSSCGCRDAEEFAAYDDTISDRQEWLIGELGGKVDKSMNRSEASDYIKELQGKKSGTWKDAESFGAENEPDVFVEERIVSILQNADESLLRDIMRYNLGGSDGPFGASDSRDDVLTAIEMELRNADRATLDEIDRMLYKVSQSKGAGLGAESCGNCGNALVMNAEGEHHCGCGTETQNAETFEARTYRKGERRNRRSMRKSRRNANLRAMKRQKGMMRMAAETDSEAVEQTDANMVSEGSVEAFYGGGAKVSVSGDNIMPTSNPSVDEAFDVGNQVGLDIAEQEVMNVNPSVEVNYGAEAFESEYDEILHDEAEVMWWGTYTGTINVPTKQGKQYYANFDIVEDPDFSAENFNADEVAYAVMWEGKEDDNDGLIYGIEYMDGDMVSDVEWFATAQERDAELKSYIEEFGAETFGAEKRYRYGDRYITRDSKGRFKKNVNVGRSLAADRRRKAKTKVTGKGQGGVGDYEAEDIVESLQNRSQRVGFSMNGWVASVLVIGASFFAGRRFEKR